MKEAYYFHDDTVILNYSKKYLTSKHEIVSAEIFDEFLNHFLDDLKTHHVDLYSYLAEGGKDNAQIKKEIKFVLKTLLISEPKEINDAYTKIPDELLAVIERGYNYWRSLQRYSILYTHNEEGFQIQSFIDADNRENNLVLDFYREIEQKVQGSRNKVFRQLQAGTNASMNGMKREDKAWGCCRASPWRQDTSRMLSI